jgi:hypothetical protein
VFTYLLLWLFAYLVTSAKVLLGSSPSSSLFFFFFFFFVLTAFITITAVNPNNFTTSKRSKTIGTAPFVKHATVRSTHDKVQSDNNARNKKQASKKQTSDFFAQKERKRVTTKTNKEVESQAEAT